MLIDLSTQRVDYIWCILKLDIAKSMVCSNKCFACHDFTLGEDGIAGVRGPTQIAVCVCVCVFVCV